MFSGRESVWRRFSAPTKADEKKGPRLRPRSGEFLKDLPVFYVIDSVRASPSPRIIARRLSTRSDASGIGE